MFQHYENAKQRWGGGYSIIDRWLKKRQRLIVRYYNVLSAEPLNPKQNQLADSMSIFCESLMNYCSISHFQVYEKLLSRAKKLDGADLAHIRSSFNLLEEITSNLVDFNDQYNSRCNLDTLMGLSASLSKVGELLEDRFVLEDELIATLHNTHQVEMTD